MSEPKAIVEIDWAEDRAGNPIQGPVGPFDSERLADEWALEVIYNGEWNTATLTPPTRVALSVAEQGSPCTNCGAPGALRAVAGNVLCDPCVEKFTEWAQRGENR